ncbi:MAG: hypothetical protein GQ570_08630 [Helicobacteraceae bacterium]|nr:hypothetical protein [Helicobacteraceae bacterium]
MIGKDFNSDLSLDAREAVPPEGISLDGDTDYLSRSSDLVGNVNGKVFTFSCTAYHTGDSILYLYSSDNINITYTTPANIIVLYMTDSVGTLKCYITFAGMAIDTFATITVSGNMDDVNSFKLFMNDTELTPTVNTFVTGGILGFQSTVFNINNWTGGTTISRCRLSNIFLDYTYRDLSIEANRRLFITAEGKPADGLASLNPILYLPMTDKATAHINEGTGGNFIQNGLIETADRGANQDNCVASLFDGVDDYMYLAPSPISDGKQMTISFNCKMDAGEYGGVFEGHNSGGTTRLNITVVNERFNLYAVNSAGSEILNLSTDIGSFPFSRLYTFTLSVDLTDNTKTRFIVNGISISINEITFLDENIFFSDVFSFWMNRLSTIYSNGSIGELYFDTSYIDLATENPFWNSETNKPIPVRTAMSTLGTNPLICMPIDASSPTKNYGSGGDFTLNGGGLVGARGASEYIARSADFGAVAKDGNLSKTTVLESSTPKTASVVIGFSDKSGTLSDIFLNFKNNDGVMQSFNLSFSSGELIQCIVNNASNSQIMLVQSSALTINSFHTVMLSFDLTNSANRSMYIDGVSNATWSTYVDDTYSLTLSDRPCIGGYFNGTSFINGAVTDIASIYFTTDYIDFSQESNRNLFVNQLGYPRNLQPLIDEGTIPNPLIYLPFDDTDNLGKNNGTGGDFTTVGTVTAGADFNI